MNSKEEIVQKFRQIMSSCLQCQKNLEDKLIKRAAIRCKRCQRTYEQHWFSNHQNFLKNFQGQL